MVCIGDRGPQSMSCSYIETIQKYLRQASWQEVIISYDRLTWTIQNSAPDSISSKSVLKARLCMWVEYSIFIAW